VLLCAAVCYVLLCAVVCWCVLLCAAVCCCLLFGAACCVLRCAEVSHIVLYILYIQQSELSEVYFAINYNISHARNKITSNKRHH